MPALPVQKGHKLDDIAILQGIPPERLARVAVECGWRSYDRGTEILSANSESTDVFLIAEGRVRVTIYSPSGREVAFRNLGPSSSFGELAAIDGRGRSASVVVLEPSVLAVLSRSRFARLMQEEPSVAAHVMQNLAALIRDLTARVVDTSTLTVPARVRAEVVRLGREAGVEQNKAHISPLPFHSDIASHIGTTREAVTRELGRMAAEGLIERSGKGLVVHDFAGLVASTERLSEE